MPEKILFVDDERSVLDALRRAFRGQFEIHLAESGEDGLKLIQDQGPFSVVISDFQMPGMDGVAFLSEVGLIAPDTVRLMLTGCGQLDISIRAVNEGRIFRFLSKPCPLSVLKEAIGSALRQYHLVKTEREYYALKKWNEGLGGLIDAFARLIESKDPYTAGHQHRVSFLSVEIAKALELSAEETEQTRLAALVHDIGKIYVPVEFLNKPGLLNSAEQNIIKMHAQIGHDILKPVGFPFPIHTIVLQHHERMDGSGYPNGLQGADILPGARIVAIADIIEAILHHRPYRPAKGPAEVIRELSAENGGKYDSYMAEKALAILEERNFHIE
ncbi:MAG TPA: HD domain-containing phosphohydrolase [Acidobacteriota bacterium]|nr:HD domain-containing phosphohydrolase [Acidobacteriota bacterium]